MSVDSWDIDPFTTDDDTLYRYTEEMLHTYDLIREFSIDPNMLRVFMCSVRELYRDNSFHNFKHGWSVMQVAYQILRSGADKCFTIQDKLVFLLAAYCHDVDHPGHNNDFEVAMRSELALSHGDDSVLERHHASTFHCLLDKNNIFEHLPVDEQKALRLAITRAIIATDAALHVQHVADLESWPQKVIETTETGNTDRNFSDSLSDYFLSHNDSRQRLLGNLMHAADLGGQVMGEQLSTQWGNRICAEFTKQVHDEKGAGLPVTSYMTGMEDRATMSKSQASFIKHVVIPLWAAVSVLFPNLSHRCQCAADNQKRFEDIYASCESAL